MLGNAPGRVKHAYGGHAAGARGHDLVDSRACDAADRQHGKRCGAYDRCQRGDTCWLTSRLGRRIEDSSENQVIETAVARRRHCIRDGMNGTSDEKRRGRHGASPWRAERIRAKVYAVGACGQRHIEAIVDEDACARAADGGETRGHKTRKGTALQVALSNLNQMHAFTRRRRDAFDERPLPRRAEAPPIRDETEDRFQVEYFELTSSTCPLFHLTAEPLQRGGFRIGPARDDDRDQLAEP